MTNPRWCWLRTRNVTAFLRVRKEQGACKSSYFQCTRSRNSMYPVRGDLLLGCHVLRNMARTRKQKQHQRRYTWCDETFIRSSIDRRYSTAEGRCDHDAEENGRYARHPFQRPSEGAEMVIHKEPSGCSVFDPLGGKV